MHFLNEFEVLVALTNDVRRQESVVSAFSTGPALGILSSSGNVTNDQGIQTLQRGGDRIRTCGTDVHKLSKFAA